MTTTEQHAGLDVGVVAGLTASLGRVADEMRETRLKRDRLVQQCHWFTVPGVPMTLSGGAGTLNQPTLFGPRTGQIWDVRRITASGFTAGSAAVYLNSTAGDQVLAFPTTGSYLFGKAQMILQPSDYLVISATGITGSVTIQVAGIEVAAPLLGDYLI